ncbi:putative transmembrane protein [Apostichopus japonicus]|uniref:Putative transmembrane protein n=1 Tax=Stichopus japonicus TaxID=307972 RepID=A0A2G8KJI5_STIJA|nr:putative transmembrane protein [Apostichopus japonicus]
MAATPTKTSRNSLATDGMTPDEVRAVVRNQAGTAVSFMLLTGVAVWMTPDMLLRHDDVISRLVFTLRCLTPVAGLCLHFILKCACYRFAIDPKKLCTDPARAVMPYVLEVNNRVLRSTVEMSVIHTILQLILSTYLDGAMCPKIIALFTIWFVCDRVAFFVGYRNKTDPLQRGYGFEINLLTMFVQLALTILLTM